MQVTVGHGKVCGLSKIENDGAVPCVLNLFGDIWREGVWSRTARSVTQNELRFYYLRVTQGQQSRV